MIAKPNQTCIFRNNSRLDSSTERLYAQTLRDICNKVISITTWERVDSEFETDINSPFFEAKFRSPDTEIEVIYASPFHENDPFKELSFSVESSGLLFETDESRTGPAIIEFLNNLCQKQQREALSAWKAYL